MAAENDVVLIYLEEQPMAFARIESILADHKPDWYHVKFTLLQIPLQVVTWILRDVYIEGDVFTMGGKSMRLEKVECPEDTESRTTSDSQAENKVSKGPGKVISLADLKKRD